MNPFLRSNRLVIGFGESRALRTTRTICTICTFLLLSSCEDALQKVVDVDLTTPDPLPVLNADWVAGDSPLTVALFPTFGPLQEVYPEAILGATVELFVDGTSNGIFVQVDRVPFRNFFDPRDTLLRSFYLLSNGSADLLPPGSEARLEATLPDGKRLSAEARVPPRPNALEMLSFEGPPMPDTARQGGGYTVSSKPGSLRVRLEDLPAAGDNYVVEIEVRDTARADPRKTLTTTGRAYSFERDDRFVFANGEYALRDRFLVDGPVEVKYSVNVNPFRFQPNGFPLPGEQPDTTSYRTTYYARLKNVSDARIDYLLSLQAALRGANSPFTEPLVLPGTVDGGLGFFGVSTATPWVRLE